MDVLERNLLDLDEVEFLRDGDSGDEDLGPRVGDGLFVKRVIDDENLEVLPAQLMIL